MYEGVQHVIAVKTRIFYRTIITKDTYLQSSLLFLYRFIKN